MGISLALGSLGVFAACGLAAVVPRSESVLRWSFVVGAVSTYALLVAELGSALFLATTGFLIFNGFIVNSTGDLSWHGAADVERLATVLLAVVLGCSIGWIYRAVRRVREQSTWTWSDQWQM